ncbi:MAG: sel1 repeat family protein [Akkermansia sp.]|nr:sel1 repeat family protein [Akkermansia sp.]
MKKSHIVYKLVAAVMLAAMVSCSTTEAPSNRAAKIFEADLVKAQAGDAEAQEDVAYAYMNGKGVEKDIQEAEKWYRKAAEQGYLKAQISLMELYGMNGELANENPEECVYWARKVYHAPNATDFDKVYSGNTLHRCYDKGYGVEKNPEKAAEWKAKYLADYQRDLRNHRRKLKQNKKN